MVAWHPRRRRNHRCPVRCSGQGIWARVAGPRRREEGDGRSVSGYNELREVITTRRGVWGAYTDHSDVSTSAAGEITSVGRQAQ